MATPTNSLPHDVLFQIFSFLTIRDLRLVSFLCKAFYEAAFSHLHSGRTLRLGTPGTLCFQQHILTQSTLPEFPHCKSGYPLAVQHIELCVCYFNLYAKTLARLLPTLPNLRSLHVVRWPLRVCGDLEDEDLVKLRTIIMYLPALEELQVPEIDKDDPNKVVGTEGEFESDMDDVIDDRRAHLELPPLKRLRVLRMDNWEWLEMHMATSLEDLYLGPIWQEHQKTQCSHVSDYDREWISQFTSLKRLRLSLVSFHESSCVESFMSMLTRFRDLELFEMEIERGELRRSIAAASDPLTKLRDLTLRFTWEGHKGVQVQKNLTHILNEISGESRLERLRLIGYDPLDEYQDRAHSIVNAIFQQKFQSLATLKLPFVIPSREDFHKLLLLPSLTSFSIGVNESLIAHLSQLVPLASKLRRLSLNHLPPLLFRYADASQLLTQGTNKLRVVKSAGFVSSSERAFKLRWEMVWKYDPLTGSPVRCVIGPRHVGDPGIYSYSSKRLSYVDCVPEHRLEKYIKHGRPSWD